MRWWAVADAHSYRDNGVSYVTIRSGGGEIGRLEERHAHTRSLTIPSHQDILKISNPHEDYMTSRSATIQIAFRYRTVDSPSGVTRKTAKRLAERLGVDETQAIHLALRELAAKVLPQYEHDNGPLSAAQVRQIRKLVPQGTKRSVRSSLVEMAALTK